MERHADYDAPHAEEEADYFDAQPPSSPSLQRRKQISPRRTIVEAQGLQRAEREVLAEDANGRVEGPYKQISSVLRVVRYEPGVALTHTPPSTVSSIRPAPPLTLAHRVGHAEAVTFPSRKWPNSRSATTPALRPTSTSPRSSISQHCPSRRAARRSGSLPPITC
jgi:hypothetical protein